MNTPFFLDYGGCKKASPVFNVKNRRFDLSLIIDVKKCRFNHAQVILCRPLAKKFRPFPTSLWLTCPYLIKIAGKIEAEGGVKELENFLIKNKLEKKWREYNLLHQLIRLKLMNKYQAKFMRKFHGKIFRTLIRGGVGGIRYGFENVNIKCLHLQTASFIGLNHHTGAEWLSSKGLCPGADCGKNFCMC
ncbi:MAG: DUF501 domain-containing protein [Synergistaceae bacterium]|nr:DUF501 domain-containing protein [Synergistaceae bacterium]